MALSTTDVEFVAGEGVNVFVRRSKTDQAAEGMVKGLPYGENKETCPVTALRTWMQAAERHVDGPFEGAIFRRFYRGESVGATGITAQYVSKILKRHARRVGLDPEEYQVPSVENRNREQVEDREVDAEERHEANHVREAAEQRVKGREHQREVDGGNVGEFLHHAALQRGRGGVGG